MERKEEINWSRWRPTKRQKEILEDLLKQVHCNGGRSRINEITNLLKQHGKVEAHNVFYWFQNTQARRKMKQKKETPQMQRTQFKSTPQVLNEKDTVKTLEGQACSSSTKADRMIVDYSNDMAQFSAQGRANSAESTSSVSTKKLLSNNLSCQQHLQSVGTDTFSEPDRFTLNMCNKAANGNDGCEYYFTDPRRSNVMTKCPDALEHERSDELLELFPLHPDGNLRSKCNSSFEDKKRTNNIKWANGEGLSLKFRP
eukprot:PITA_10858